MTFQEFHGKDFLQKNLQLKVRLFWSKMSKHQPCMRKPSTTRGVWQSFWPKKKSWSSCIAAYQPWITMDMTITTWTLGSFFLTTFLWTTMIGAKLCKDKKILFFVVVGSLTNFGNKGLSSVFRWVKPWFFFSRGCIQYIFFSEGLACSACVFFFDLWHRAKE